MVAAFAVLLIVVGCSDDSDEDTTGPGTSKPITVDGIIVNPKSPAPGDTVQLTAVVSSSSTNPGDFVSYSWSADGGTFIEDNLGSVRWVAPTNSTVYEVSVSAQNSVSSSANSEPVFVGMLVVTVPSNGGQFIPIGTGDFYYLSSPVTTENNNFGPTGVRFNDGVDDTEISPPIGFQYKFNGNSSEAVFTNFPTPFQLEIEWLDMQSGARRTIGYDRRPVIGGGRYRLYTDPDITPDSQFACYWALLTDAVPPSQNGIDTAAVMVQDLLTEEENMVTFANENYYPSFSTDGEYLVWISNRTIGSTSRWDLFQLPVLPTGVPPDTAGQLVQLTAPGDPFVAETTPPDPVSIKWSPSGSAGMAAIENLNRDLYLIPMNNSGNVEVSLPGNLGDFAWSPNGQEIVAVSGQAIYRVDRNGGFTTVVETPGDNLSLPSWSPDASVIVFQRRRLNDTWWEVFDLSGSLGLDNPLPLTPSRSQGDGAIYAQVFSTEAAWFPDNTTVNLLFFDGSTPSAERLDLSGLLQQ